MSVSSLHGTRRNVGGGWWEGNGRSRRERRRAVNLGVRRPRLDGTRMKTRYQQSTSVDDSSVPGTEAAWNKRGGDANERGAQKQRWIPTSDVRCAVPHARPLGWPGGVGLMEALGLWRFVRRAGG